MGDFVTAESTPTVFADKEAAPGLSLRSGWAPNNVASAADLNAIKNALLDLRAAAREVRFTNVLRSTGNDDTALIREAFDDTANSVSDKTLLVMPGDFVVAGMIETLNTRGLEVLGRNTAGTRFLPTAALEGLPVFKLTNVRDSRFSGFKVEGYAAAKPRCAFEIRSEDVDDVISTHNTFENLWIGGDATSLIDGFRMTCGSGEDTNNDAHQFLNCRVENLIGACYSIEHSNSLWHLIQNGQLLNAGLGVDCLAGSFDHVNAAMVNMRTWDYRLGTDAAATQHHASAVSNVKSETNEPANASGSLYVGAALAARISFNQYRRTGGKNSAANMVDIRSDGAVVSFMGCDIRYGQSNQRMSATGSNVKVKLFANLALSFDEYVWGVGSGVWTTIANHHIPEEITETMEASGRIFQMGDTQEGGGGGAEYLPGNIRAYGLGFSGASDIKMNFFSGTVANITGASTTVRIDFPDYNARSDYRVGGPTIRYVSGTPATKSAVVTTQDDVGFTLTLDAAPGVGNVIEIDWSVSR